ncbi:MAG TPA: 2-succinyl-5-enolpyruvyl-6-hydroxy-3-cyclohexene-1-carboxylic-acid synthase [Actinomycetota bacterium]|nr:2-succinyl-5-enolpyruvyl-6-hydroxy-3-cyclohexene-1-carboxylic-acid synthase [Actinomycetota bacterium]
MKATNPSHAFGLVIVDEFARHGLRHAVLSPGSRSAPVSLALASDDRIELHVQIDERSAAFTALGLARAAGAPCALLSTSGTAGANFHPAVVEASNDRVPLLVLTADRPPELRGTGANQTIDQVKLYGDAVRWFCDTGVPEALPGAPRYWRSLASRAWAEATGRPPGPVHLNVPLREPLVPGDGEYPYDLGGRSGGRAWTATSSPVSAPSRAMVERLSEMVARAERGIVLAGAGVPSAPEPVLEFARHAGYPILAEPASGLRTGPLAISTTEALLRAGFGEEHHPDLVIRIGKTGLSRPLAAWLHDGVEQVLLDPDGAWLDPERGIGHIFKCDAAVAAARVEVARGETEWTRAWCDADALAGAAIDDVLDASGLSEPRIARDLAATLEDGTALFVGASMPVRDLDWFMRPRSGVTVFGNRGANGIDGVVSSAVGVALAHPGPSAALVGDLTLLHDQNGLLLSRNEPVDLAIVVLNNDGGGIFSFLPQADAPEHFERVFGTPHGVDFADLARVYGAEHVVIGAPDDLRDALPGDGVRIIEVRTDRTENVEVHRACWAAARRALTGSG